MLKAVSALDTRRGSRPRRDRLAFTLIEVLVATGLTLLIMSAVAAIFVLVTDNVNGARANIELAERLRATQNVLQHDLFGLTARGIPPLDPANGFGYTEIIEGPVGPCAPPNTVLVNYSTGVPLPDPDLGGSNPAAPERQWGESWDTSVGDYDDVLQFTTRSTDVPFTGRGPMRSANGNLIRSEAQSNVAEVSWFVRGRTLYRRVLLVDPTYNATFFTDTNNDGASDGVWAFPGESYHAMCDISVRQAGGSYDPTVPPPASGDPASAPRLVANSLGDLTKRENRYGHQPILSQMVSGQLVTNWPHDARFWASLRLPTLRETSAPNWPLPFFAAQPATVHPAGVVLPAGLQELPTPAAFADLPTVIPPGERVRFDAWSNPRQWESIDSATGSLLADLSAPPTNAAQQPLLYEGTRFADDVILTNVIGFDVKVWDQGAPIFQRRKRIGVQNGPFEWITLAPGDPGYVQALLDLNPNDSATLPASFGAFVDLGWGVNPANGALIYPPSPATWAPPAGKQPQFHHAGNPASGLHAIYSNQAVDTPPPDMRARVYDTGSSHYERDGSRQYLSGSRVDSSKQQNAPPDQATDGLDNDSVNGIDDVYEREAPPPYDAELKAIQVKIRVFEPDSRQVREVTVVQELVSQ